MRAYAAGKAAAAGTNLLPSGSLYAIANRPLYLVEVAVWNDTDTVTEIALQKLTTAGTQGSAVTAFSEDDAITPVGTAFNTHTSTGPTITSGFVRRSKLAAIGGSGIYWTFGSHGLRIPPGTANGVGLTVPFGTGQVWVFEFVWDE